MLEISNTRAKMSTFDKLISGLHKAEERICDLEDRPKGTPQMKLKQKNNNKHGTEHARTMRKP